MRRCVSGARAIPWCSRRGGRFGDSRAPRLAPGQDLLQPVTVVTDTGTRPSYSLRQLVAYALKLGSLGFGGPVALVGYMHRDLVERRGWIADADYREGLTLAQLAPGPLAAQLAIYLGF